MSTSSETKSRKRKAAGGAYRAPLTVSAAALLENGGDNRFRKLVYDLITIAVRLETVRDLLSRRMGVSGPQYSILMVVAQAHGAGGVTVSAVADQLHVSGAFVTAEAGKLVRAGLVDKRANPEDRRSVLLCLTVEGQALVGDVAADIRATNDRFFGALGREDFLTLGRIVERMVGSSREALSYLAATAELTDAAE
jgi:MarR family transcriptional regulator, organic hydroperoxide resistance regulator